MSPRRRSLQRWTRLLERIDRVIVLCRTQERYLLEELGFPSDRVRFVYNGVDQRFFSLRDASAADYIVSVGREQRDYATLVEAVRSLDVPVVIVPSSAWTPRRGQELDTLPSHVQVRYGLTYDELRRLYEAASIVVVPLRAGINYAAGVNGLLEGMAMRKPVVVSHSPGLADYVAPGETAEVVPAENPAALREAIAGILADPGRAETIAANGRRAVDETFNLDTFVRAVSDIVSELAPIRSKRVRARP